MKINFNLIRFLLLSILVGSCGKTDYVPKPEAYFRIDLPEKEYVVLKGDYPYVFEYPKYAHIVHYEKNAEHPYWMNIVFPDYKAKIHISFDERKSGVNELLEEARRLAYKHTVKADAIGEKTFYDYENRVYGILYDIKGDAASSAQFFLTDSTSRFFRGALYFNAQPNKDSIKPVLNFFKEDIIHLIETLKWQ